MAVDLKEGMALYVRIDDKAGGKDETEQDALDSMNYLQQIAKERFLLAGIFGDPDAGCVDGTMILFAARDLEEAKKIACSDPIIERGFYRCEIRRWNVMLQSDKINP